MNSRLIAFCPASGTEAGKNADRQYRKREAFSWKRAGLFTREQLIHQQAT